METSTGPVTVRVALPVMLLAVATMEDDPASFPMAKPPEVIVATALFKEVQVTEPTKSFEAPSLYRPVAENCCAPPMETVELAGVTRISRRRALVESELPHATARAERISASHSHNRAMECPSAKQQGMEIPPSIGLDHRFVEVQRTNAPSRCER